MAQAAELYSYGIGSSTSGLSSGSPWYVGALPLRERRCCMRIRPTVGVLVLDATQRVLLFRVASAVALDDARPDVTSWWGPPGGGVAGAETCAAAGLREVWEETGLRVAQLGPW